VEFGDEVKRFCFRRAADLADAFPEALVAHDSGYSLSPKGFTA
jgi:hypothetical protein